MGRVPPCSVQSLAVVARGFCTVVPVSALHLLSLTNAVVDVLKLCSGDSRPRAIGDGVQFWQVTDRPSRRQGWILMVWGADRL